MHGLTWPIQVVIAAISPLAKDLAHSANTLGYAAPLRVAAAAPMSIERDPRDPANWSNQEIVDWVAEQAQGGQLDPHELVGGMSGLQLCALPEPALFRRVEARELARIVHAHALTPVHGNSST